MQYQIFQRIIFKKVTIRSEKYTVHIGLLLFYVNVLHQITLTYFLKCCAH